MTSILLSVAAMFMAVAGLIYAGHVAIVYQRFNDGIKDWANALDESTRSAIDRQAMEILRELDQRITEQKALENQELENQEDVEPLNINEDEKD